MSEPEMLVVDETPPPDIVERPARSSGAYKLCMQCGHNVLRFEYRAGSSVCKRCEEAIDRKEDPLMEPATFFESPVEDADAHAGPEEVPAQASVVGSAAALAWLTGACGATGPLTLDALAVTLRDVLAQQAAMIGRVTRYGVGPQEVRPEDVPLEVAAEALYLACDPLLQEKLRAAMEVLRLSLNQVILGNLAYHEQELLNQDQSLVPQASYAAQYETGVGGRRAAPGRSSVPGRPLVDAQGQLIKACLCCGREFHPTPQRPNPDFCDESCGTFVDQLRVWATNTVLDELRYGIRDAAPLPDPRTYWPLERCQEPFLTVALTFRERRAAQQMAQAREQQQKMRGL